MQSKQCYSRIIFKYSVQFSCSVVSAFATPWMQAHQASLPFTIFCSIYLQICSHCWVWPSAITQPFCTSVASTSVQFNSVAQLCPTLCDPMDCSSPGSSVHWIFQARILEWVAISRGSSWPRNRTCVSCVSCFGRRILYHCTTWKAFDCSRSHLIPAKGGAVLQGIKLKLQICSHSHTHTLIHIYTQME